MTYVDRGSGSGGRAKRRLQFAVLVVIVGDLFALLAHDGGSSARSVAATDASSPAPTAGSPTAPAVAPTTTVAPAVPQSASRGGNAPTPPTAPPKSTPTTAPPESSGDYTFVVTLEPTCAHVGELFTATFRVEPSAAVAMIAAYADGQTHASMWGTTAPDSGVVTRTWPAPPALGPGQLLTGATTPDGRSGGTKLAFYIAKAGEPCPPEYK